VYNSLRPSDLVSVWTFSQSVNEILPMCRKRDIPSMRSVLATIQTGGGTAMRDAIAQQIEHRRTHPDSSRAFELVVLTDGEDNSSTISEQDLAELLRRPGSPHFHLILIGVGIAAEYRTRLEALCQPDHCTFMSVESSAEAISGAFHRTTEAIQHRRVVTVTTTTTREVVASGRAPLDSAVPVPVRQPKRLEAPRTSCASDVRRACAPAGRARGGAGRGRGRGGKASASRLPDASEMLHALVSSMEIASAQPLQRAPRGRCRWGQECRDKDNCLYSHE